MTTSNINLLTDGNFESVSLAPDAPGYNQGSPDGAYNGLVPFGWTSTGSVGAFAPTTSASPGFAGSQVAYLNPNGAISQSLATPDVSEAGFDQYVVSLDVGIRLQGAPTSGTVTIEAMVGSTVVGSITFDPTTATAGAVVPLSFTTEDLYTAGLAGQPITLAISNGANGQVLVDNVTVQPPNLITDGNFNDVNLADVGVDGVQNGGAPGNYTDASIDPIAGWTLTQGEGGLFAPTTVASDSDTVNPPGFQGSDVAYLVGTNVVNSATPTTLTQTFATPTVASGPERLAISLELGTRIDTTPTSGTVTVTAKVGSTVIGETTFNPVAATPGEAYTVQFTTDDLAALGLAGQNVTLSITNDANSQVLLGNVNAAVVTAPSPPVTTLTFDVNTEAELNSAIQAINVGGADAAGNGVYQINITGAITLTGQITALHLAYGESVTIAGTTSGASAAQVETIDGQSTYQGFFAYSGNITLQDLNIDNTVAQGANGGAGGGGGAGLGGGLFVSGSTGGGGSASVTLKNVGFSGDAAKGGNGGINGISNGSGGGLDSGIFSLGAGQYGGGGSYKHVGGFGGGGGRGTIGSVNSGGGGGIAGGFGGGGGGGGFNEAVGTSHGTIFVPIDEGGSVFGGGESGLGSGGGGLGAGGDIFVQQGGSLTIEGDALGGGSLGAGSVAGGAAGGSQARNGSAFGSGLFLSGNQSFTLAPLSGQTLTVAGVVADMSGSGSGGLGQLIIDGAGTVVLSAANTYQGGTTVKEGTLSIFTASNIGGGSLTLDNGTTVDFTASFTLYNNIIVSGDPTFNVASGQTNALGGSISNSTSGPAGVLVVTGGGTLVLANANTYSGGTTIEDGSTFEIGTNGSAGTGSITFGSSNDTLQIDGSLSPSPAVLLGGAALSGFAPGDLLDLRGVGYTGGATAQIVGSQLDITEGGKTYLVNLTDPSSYSGHTFSPVSDSHGGTLIEENSPACFCRGTRILTATGVVAVEDLAVGDLVVTLSGEGKPIRWIGRRAYDGRFVAGNRAVLPVRIAEGALGEGVPVRELWVSPEHALYLGGALVPAGLLVNRASIVQIEEVDRVEYFHIELAAHDVIFAEGAPAESYIEDDNRGIFHNAVEFRALYPDAPARVPARYCAPRLEEGFALEALRRRLAGRAARLGADRTAPPGVLQGLLERVDRGRIAGWAFDPTSPDTPVGLVILANGAEIGRVVADCYRRDLEEAGIGEGHHAFELTLPGGLAAGVRHEIEVCREVDWSGLPGSPSVLEPIAAGLERNSPHRPAGASPALGALRGHIDIAERRRIAGWAQDSADPERRVGLLVTVNGQVIGRVLANGYRRDLETAGIGDGRHAFELLVPPAVRNSLPALQAWEIRVEREADGAELPGSPLTLPAAYGFDLAVEQSFAGILAAAASGAAEDRALAFLTEQTDRLLARRAERHGGRAEREAHRLFRRRWGPQGENGRGETGSQPSRPLQLRALVVDRQVPCAERDAGSLAILSHVRALRGLGYEVSFAASDEMGDAAALARLAEAEGIAICGFPHYSCVEDVLSRQAGSFDLVYLHRPENADRYLPLVRRYCPKARVLYSVADLHHLRVARQAKVEGRPELLAHSRYLAAIEMMAARRADLVITHSPVEAELLRREVGFGKVHVVPFAVASRPPRRPFAERHGVAFLGSFGHAPNPDAVHHLAHDILPRVWARDPELTCKIVGHGWDAGRLARLDPRIEMVGKVADLDAVFDTVRLTVAPLRFGAGIKGKVLDSFAACLPCVMTPIAAEGLALTGSLPQLVADNPGRLAELIVHLHTDRHANDQAGRDGARMVASECSDERVSDALREILSNSVSAADNPSRETPTVASVA